MLSKEMTQMLDVIKEFDTQIQKDGNLTRYFAPNIPEKVIKKLIKNFDNNLPVNSVIAYYDTTLIHRRRELYLQMKESITKIFWVKLFMCNIGRLSIVIILLFIKQLCLTSTAEIR